MGISPAVLVLSALLAISARFFDQLNPCTKKSFLSVESRREMTRHHWRVPDLSVEKHYGLGVIHGNVGDWPWFGHSGTFQGFTSHTAVMPHQSIALSVLTNAADGGPTQLFDGIVGILQAFAKDVQVNRAITHWSGRWWGPWGATDLVPIGGSVFALAPAQPNPFVDASELTIDDLDNATITKAGGFANFGEQVRLLRNAKGDVTEVWFAGNLLQSEQEFANEVKGFYLGG